MRLLLLVLALAMEALLLRLGVWQLARAEEKQQALQAVAEVVRDKRAQSLEPALQTHEGYTWVEGRLRFEPRPMVLLDNQRRDAQVGVTVYQLASTAGGQSVLVELGWLPVNGQRQLPKPAALQGEIRLSGLLLPPPASGFALGNALVRQADGTLLLTRFDSKALSNALQRPVTARVLRVDPDMAIGFARDLNVQANTLPPEKHRAYAVQWFGLAAAFAVLCAVVWRRKSNANRCV